VAGEQATFAINLSGNASEASKEAAEAMEALRQKIQGSEAAIRQIGGAMSRLKGSSEEVTKAKADLKAQIDGERNAITEANLALVKAGVSYETLAVNAKKLALEQAALAKSELEAAAAAKKLASDQEALANATAAEAAKKLAGEQGALAKTELEAAAAAKKLAGEQAALAKAEASASAKKLAGEQEELAKKHKATAEAAKQHATEQSALTQKFAGLDGVKKTLEDIKTAFSGSGGAANLATVAVAGLAVAVAAVAAAAVAAGVALAGFIISAANAARTANLFREAATGSATSATNLGDHIDILSGKVSTSKEKLNEMAIGLAHLRISGQAQVDTLNAVAQASDAMGDSVGNTFKGIVERSQQAQRMFIGPQELFGTGVEFDDVAAQLSKQLGIGMAAARQQLLNGAVKLDDGAKALRATIEKRFGSINARKLLDLNVQAQKFHERLESLTKDVNLDGLLSGLAEIGSVFDENTVTGAALKELVTAIGNGLSESFKAAAPIVKQILKGLIIGALEVGIAFLKLRRTFAETFGDKSVTQGVDGIQAALKVGKVAAEAFGVTLEEGYLMIMMMARGIQGTVAAFQLLYNAVKGVKEFLGLGWGDIGHAIVTGITGGITAGAADLLASTKGLADKVKGEFKSALGIASPSKVFHELGQFTAQGFSDGVDSGSGGAADAVASMVALPAAPSAPASPGAAGAPGGGGVTVHVEINVQGGGSPEGAAKAISAPSIMAQLVKAIEDGLKGGGIPVTA